MTEIFRGNLLELYKIHRDEVDLLSDRLSLFILFFVDHVGRASIRELRKDIRLRPQELRSKLDLLQRGQMLLEAEGQLTVTALGKRFLSEIGLTPPLPPPPPPEPTAPPEAPVPPAGMGLGRLLLIGLGVASLGVVTIAVALLLLWYFFFRPPSPWVPTEITPITYPPLEMGYELVWSEVSEDGRSMYGEVEVYAGGGDGYYQYEPAQRFEIASENCVPAEGVILVRSGDGQEASQGYAFVSPACEEEPGTLIWHTGPSSPLDDERVGLALDYAVDEGYATEVLFPEGQGRVIYGGGPSLDRESTEYDPDKAFELLAEAGYPQGGGLRPLLLEVDHDDPTAAFLADLIVEQLLKVGVRVRVGGLPSGKGDIVVRWR